MSALRLAILVTAAAFAAVFALPSGPVLGASYVVDTTDDDPTVAKTACTGTADDCSLRGALTNASAASSPGDVITFDAGIFPAGVPATITLGSSLPSLSDGGDTVDGTGAGVIIDGDAGDAQNFVCLGITSAGNTVMGLQFTDCLVGIQLPQDTSDNNVLGPDNTFFDNGTGIFAVAGSDGNTIIGSYIGTTSDGTAIHPDGSNSTGIAIGGADNTVGGTTPADRNIIAGNATAGVNLGGVAGTGNVVIGNYIGTDVTGTLDLGNSFGVRISNGAENTIGGDTPAERNIISGNITGVRIADPAATGNTVTGNYIGTDVSGTLDLGNENGITLTGAADNTIGGTVAGAGNLISGNNGHGVRISDPGATGNTVIGNYIGTDVTGTAEIGNSNGAVVADSASGNTIGGTTPGEANLISGNGLSGVTLQTSASSNSVIGNVIGLDSNGNGGAVGNNYGVRFLSGASDNTAGPGNVISDSGLTGVQFFAGGTTGNVLTGNLIGTDLTGTSGVPNNQGVLIEDSASGNTIGGTSAGDGNVIAFNGAAGVEVDGTDAPSAVDNAIRGNSIHSNTGLEIDNVSGGNTELAPPILHSTVGATVTGFACPNCEVDVFSDNSTDARFYEGTTTAAGDGSFALQNDGPLIGSNVRATNTDATGNTSELSPFVAIDSDADGTADETDTDDDNDGVLDASDPCRVFPEDFDGFEDSDGCPDPDNDQDGICDPGQTNISCMGSDSGKACFDPAGTLSCPTTDCRNVAEDVDAFHDDDGCHEPDNDNDGFPDSTDACPGTDAHAGPDGMLGSPEDLNHNGVSDGAEAPLTSDDVVLVFEDYDGVLDTDGCHDSPGDDFDGDGFTDDIEALGMGTNAGDGCPNTGASDGIDNDGDTQVDEVGEGANDEEPDAWPPDADDDQDADVGDLIILFGNGKILIDDEDPLYSARSDFDADGDLDVGDLLNAFFGTMLTSCTG